MHPFFLLPPGLRRWLLLGALSASIAIGLYMTVLAWPLTTAAAPAGIASYEFARTPEKAAQVLDGWKVPEKRAPETGEPADVRDQIVIQQPRALLLRAFDVLVTGFLFVFAYALTLSLGCLWAAEQSMAPTVGVIFGWLVWIAGLADAAARTLLLRMIGQGVSAEPAQAAFWLAIAKLVILLYALEYLGWAAWRKQQVPAAVACHVAAVLLILPPIQNLLR